MPYLIDSDWVIDHLAGKARAQELLAHLAPDGIAISVITYMEVYQGLLSSTAPEQAESFFNTFVARVPVVPFTLGVARRCAEVRQALKKERRRVNSRALDLIIAATALEENLTLVTRNREDYADVPELDLYQDAVG